MARGLSKIATPRLLTWIGFAGLLLAWALGTPAGSAPDERTHYLRAASLGHGQLLGDPDRVIRARRRWSTGSG